MGLSRRRTIKKLNGRKISNKNRKFGNFVGTFFSSKMQRHIDYESLAERTILIKLESDLRVKSYYTQQIQIPVAVGDDKWDYTPDIHVKYEDNTLEVIEVKKKKEDTLKKSVQVKKKASEEFCDARSWTYSIVCEEDIDPIYKRNLKFLFGFRNRKHGYETWAFQIKGLVRNKGMTIQGLIDELEIPDLLPLIYYMISKSELEIVMTKPINLESEIMIGRS